MIRAVVRKELATLWATPIPWVAGALLQAILGLLFVEQLRGRQQATVQPLFPLAGFLLLFSVPVLTMRTFADEARLGTLDLLLAAGVPARVLVGGKWLAAWLSAVAVVVPSLACVALLALYGGPDWGPVASGYVGLLLLTALLSGIGVLASTLSSSQPVAATVTFFSVVLLWFSHVGSEGLSAGGALAHFSISERLRSFAGGALDTSDLAFFTSMTGITLVVAAVVVEARRLR